MKTAKSLLCCVPALLVSSAFAQSQGDQEAWRRAGQELVECAAFDRLATAELEKQGKPELADSFRSAAGRALELAQVYLPAASISKRLAAAQQTLAAKSATAGFNPLIGEYGTRCKSALEQPGQRLNYWREENADGAY